MIIRYVTIIFTAAMLAATVAVGSLVVEPKEAEAVSNFPVRTCDRGTIELNAEERKTLELHNRMRAEKRLPRFCVHPGLTEAARAHSKEMLDKDYFSHSSFNGENFGVRLKREGYKSRGYKYWTAGENIAWGSGSYHTPVNRFDTWMKSSGHRTNILNKRFREIGIGVEEGTYKSHSGARMYTVDFGTRRR